VPVGKFIVIVSVCDIVSETVIVNRSEYCLLTKIVPFELEIDKLVIGLGVRLLTYVVQVSILEPETYEVIVIPSDGCPVGGDKKLFMEKLKDVETCELNKFEAATTDCEILPH
jgi:hypothetical protein